MTYKHTVFALLLLAIVLLTAYTHSGRLASDGCHNDRSKGTRHCHSTTEPDSQEKQSNTYNRKDWKHWIDNDNDCQNTRQEVLIEENIGEIVMSADGCKVISGVWHDSYTDNTYTNPSDLDIDHYIPLKEVYLSGGNKWSSQQKKLYANYLVDPNHLIAVSKSANRKKGAKDPSQWLPPNPDYVCKYVYTWTTIKRTWQLHMDNAEMQAIKNTNAKYGCK